MYYGSYDYGHYGCYVCYGCYGFKVIMVIWYNICLDIELVEQLFL
jgi:hypothetical protein